MGLNILIIFFTFSVLTIAGLLLEEQRYATLSRSSEEWTMDILGLFIQGVIIPAVPFAAVPMLAMLLPDLERSLDIDPFLQFLLAFVGVDYLYYWNHRFFHTKEWWSIHRLHHSSRHLDVLATSRNSLLTSFLFVYVWIQILAIFLFQDSTAFLLGLGLTFALDIWRHSGLQHPALIDQLLGWALILPEQHVLHHSLKGRNKNFGANLCWWDKIHGTFSPETIANRNLEKLNSKNIWRELLVPWRKG